MSYKEFRLRGGKFLSGNFINKPTKIIMRKTPTAPIPQLPSILLLIN